MNNDLQHEASAFVSVCDVSKRFGNHDVLRGVSLSLFTGQVLGLIGPNGAGKTTLLECLSGVQPADRCDVRWDKAKATSTRDLMFYLPEAAIPYPENLVKETLSFFQTAFRRTGDYLGHVVAELSIDVVRRQRVGELSKGWRRRLLLAIGLLSTQPVLLLDEPFDGLDLRQTREAMNILRRVAASGRALLLSVHSLTDAERACDRFVLLNSGQVVGEGALASLRAQVGASTATLEDIFLALT